MESFNNERNDFEEELNDGFSGELESETEDPEEDSYDDLDRDF